MKSKRKLSIYVDTRNRTRRQDWKTHWRSKWHKITCRWIGWEHCGRTLMEGDGFRRERFVSPPWRERRLRFLVRSICFSVMERRFISPATVSGENIFSPPWKEKGKSRRKRVRARVTISQKKCYHIFVILLDQNFWLIIRLNCTFGPLSFQKLRLWTPN